MSDDSTPRPYGQQPLTPPPSEQVVPPVPLAPQPERAYPGAAPTYLPPPPPASPATTSQPGNGALPAQPGYGTPPAQSGYVNLPAQPGYGLAPAQSGYPAAAQPGYGLVPAQPGYPNPSAPPQAYAGYPTPGYPAPAARPASGLAIASLICGIAGVVLFWAVVPFLASIAAVVTGHMALRQTRRNPGIGGRGMAFAGLILGYIMVGIAAVTVVTAVIGFLFMGVFTLPFLISS